MNFLFTRESRYLGTLPQALSQIGVHLHHLPTLDIHPILSKAACDHIARTLSSDTPCVFISRTAIRYMRESLLQHCPDWPNIPCIALGPGSHTDLSSLGVPDHCLITPALSPYDTEHLLTHPFFQKVTNIHNRNFVLFRGQTGRTLLHEWLHQHNASLTEIELYHRRMPTLSDKQCYDWYRVFPNMDITLISSAESLQNLLNMVVNIAEKVGIRADLLSTFKQKPLLVPSHRLDQLAKSLGFTYITQTGGLQDTVIVNAVKQLMAS